MAKKKNYRKRARAIVSNPKAGLKGSLLSALAGVGTGVGGVLAAGHFQFLNDKWYIVPLVEALVGHGIKRMGHRDVGSAVIGAAAGNGYSLFKLHQASVAAGSPGTNGVQDTGSVYDNLAQLRALPDVGAVQDSTVMKMSAVGR